MGKAIELTWKNADGVIRTEYCKLVSEEDPYYMVGTSEPIGTVGDIAGDYVMFEDGVGLFMVKPSDVVNIRHLT